MLPFFKKIFAGKNKTAMESLIKNAFLVDVRSPSEFADGHVQGSVNIPLDQVSKKLNAFENKEAIIVFCASGIRSSQAKRILQNNGFENVTNGGTWKSINQYIIH